MGVLSAVRCRGFPGLRSWSEIAAAYEALVDSRIAAAKKSGLETPPKNEVRAIAARLAAELHQKVRYTGPEFGDAAIVPATPEEVMARRYGDCKDKATVLVAALRESGLDAYVALLHSGAGFDVNPGLPGMGAFSHAIVYVAGPEPLWIDATAQHTRVGELPAADQGRLALIAATDTVGLIKTPESSAAENRTVRTVELRLPEYGRSEVREITEASGENEAGLRARFSGGDTTRVKESIDAQLKPLYLVDALDDFATTPAGDVSQPFRTTVSAKRALRAVAEEDQAVAWLFTHLLFSDLPYDRRQSCTAIRDAGSGSDSGGGTYRSDRS